MNNVFPLDPDADPRIGNLYDRLREEINNTVAGTDITMAAVLGILDVLKYDLIVELRD